MLLGAPFLLISKPRDNTIEVDITPSTLAIMALITSLKFMRSHESKIEQIPWNGQLSELISFSGQFLEKKFQCIFHNLILENLNKERETHWLVISSKKIENLFQRKITRMFENLFSDLTHKYNSENIGHESKSTKLGRLFSKIRFFIRRDTAKNVHLNDKIPISLSDIDDRRSQFLLLIKDIETELLGKVGRYEIKNYRNFLTRFNDLKEFLVTQIIINIKKLSSIAMNNVINNYIKSLIHLFEVAKKGDYRELTSLIAKLISNINEHDDNSTCSFRLISSMFKIIDSINKDNLNLRKSLFYAILSALNDECRETRFLIISDLLDITDTIFLNCIKNRELLLLEFISRNIKIKNLTEFLYDAYRTNILFCDGDCNFKNGIVKIIGFLLNRVDYIDILSLSRLIYMLLDLKRQKLIEFDYTSLETLVKRKVSSYYLMANRNEIGESLIREMRSSLDPNILRIILYILYLVFGNESILSKIIRELSIKILQEIDRYRGSINLSKKRLLFDMNILKFILYHKYIDTPLIQGTNLAEKFLLDIIIQYLSLVTIDDISKSYIEILYNTLGSENKSYSDLIKYLKLLSELDNKLDIRVNNTSYIKRLGEKIMIISEKIGLNKRSFISITNELLRISKSTLIDDIPNYRIRNLNRIAQIYENYQ